MRIRPKKLSQPLFYIQRLPRRSKKMATCSYLTTKKMLCCMRNEGGKDELYGLKKMRTGT